VPTANPICSQHINPQARCSIPRFARGKWDEHEKSTVSRRDEFVLVTKGFLRITPGLHDIGLSRAHIIRACEASLRRLRTDYLDLYICHPPDSFVAVAETMRAFDDLVTQGKVRYVGCSNHSAWQVMKALAVSEKHNLTRYVCQQVNYSLIARDVEHEIVPLALDQAVGLMAWSPLQAGLLSGKWARSAPLAKNRSGWPSLSKSITPTPDPNVSTMCFSADAPFSWRNVMPDSAATLLNCTGRACRGSGLAACWLQRGKSAESSSKFAPKIRKALRIRRYLPEIRACR
jgi:hypothetical protein